MEPVIIVKNLVKQYAFYRKEPGIKGSIKALFYRKKEFRDAVKDINFSIERGELVGFLGPNGAGKTTTLKILSCIVERSGGSANVLGYDPGRRQPEYKSRFAIVMGQKDQLIGTLPCFESFKMVQALYGISDKVFTENLEELVTLLDVRDLLDIQVRKLSLGQRMKCELIAALLHKPEVLFLDEPTIGLDVVAQKSIREFIKHYNQKNKTTIILTSHYMEDIEELCKRVIIIDKGSIIYDGQLSDLIKKHAPYKLLKVTFTQDITREQLAGLGEISEFQPYAATLRVRREEATKTAAMLLNAGLPVDDLLIDEVEVDDVIRTIFNEKR